MEPIPIGVIGAGSFGTVLADLFSRKGHEVTLWGRDPEVIREINERHTNQNYLPGAQLSPFKATLEFTEACNGKKALVFATPAQFIRSILTTAKPCIAPDTLVVNTAKGIEQGTLQTPSGVFKEVFGEASASRFVVLSGPTFAKELANKEPSGAVVASANPKAAKQAQEWLSLDTFRLYTSNDVIGVEIGGALKNVMAIGTGIAEGLGFGLNTRAGLITRCLFEMSQLGKALGANPLTFSGLSGLGDLILTCTGELSRNRFVGLELGRGKTLEQITRDMKHVVEGVATAKSVYELSRRHGIEMPNSTYVYRILYENLAPRKALQEILNRALRPEISHS